MKKLPLAIAAIAIAAVCSQAQKPEHKKNVQWSKEKCAEYELRDDDNFYKNGKMVTPDNENMIELAFNMERCNMKGYKEGMARQEKRKAEHHNKPSHRQ